MIRVAIINQKGGVGKTTTAVNLAGAFAEKGLRTLLIDLDSQASTTLSLGFDEEDINCSMYDLLEDRVPAEQAILERDGFDLIPSEVSLGGVDLEFSAYDAPRHLLSERLSDLDGAYDIVLVDCPPSLGLMNVNALTFAEYVLVPIQCGFLSLQGISNLFKTIRRVREKLNPDLKVLGILPCKYDSRTKLSGEVLEEIQNHFGKLTLTSKIRVNVRLAEAPSHGETIFEYDSSSRGAEDYRRVCEELLARLPLSPEGEEDENPETSAVTSSDEAGREP